MRLKVLKIKNFRSYENETLIPIDESLTGVVGKNDAGKSTILEALEIFFNSSVVKPEVGDLSVNTNDERFYISCIFDQLPTAIILDENIETTLAKEYLLNNDSDFEIKKTYKIGATAKLETTTISCIHPTEESINGLLSKKISELKALGKAKGVDGDVADQRVSSQWREVIWESVEDKKLTLTDINVDKELSTEGKTVWKKIEVQLPLFALFKSDRESSDSDPEAKNPLQLAVKQAQAALKDEIEALEAKIESSVLDVASRTLSKLQEMAPDIAKELSPRFKDKPKWTFNFTIDGEDGIPINKRGSGVRRLILLNFFRAEAEKRKATEESPRVIYAIEEPETSQHPNFQIMLMNSLLNLSLRDDTQILVTTHVPALAGLLPVEGIRYVSKDEDQNIVIKLPDENILQEVSDSLGILPEIGLERAKGVVLVEGKSDITFVKHGATTLKGDGFLTHDFDDKEIVPIQVGGCGNVKHWVTQRLVDQLGLPWCVFLDSDKGDPQQEKANLKRKSEVEAIGKSFFSTRKREIENYLCPSLINNLTGAVVTYSDTDDAKTIIGTAVGMSLDDVSDRYWPQMDSQRMIDRSKYLDGGSEKIEIIEILEGILSLTDDAET